MALVTRFYSLPPGVTTIVTTVVTTIVHCGPSSCLPTFEFYITPRAHIGDRSCVSHFQRRLKLHMFISGAGECLSPLHLYLDLVLISCTYLFILISCALMFCLHVCLSEGAGSSETGVRDNCEVLCGCLELNLGPLEEKPVLLTTKESLQPHQTIFLTFAHLDCFKNKSTASETEFLILMSLSIYPYIEDKCFFFSVDWFYVCLFLNVVTLRH